MGALGNLVANVAHNFNNLLMVVAANMELARRKNFNGLEREVLAVERATAGAEALAQRRAQTTAQAGADRPLCLVARGNRVDRNGGRREGAGEGAGVASDMWQVRADATELEFAIINIAVNARDAMPQGDRFVIRCQNVRMTADNVLPDGEYALLAFTDSCEGMPETTARRVRAVVHDQAADRARGLRKCWRRASRRAARQDSPTCWGAARLCGL